MEGYLEQCCTGPPQGCLDLAGLLLLSIAVVITPWTANSILGSRKPEIEQRFTVTLFITLVVAMVLHFWYGSLVRVGIA